MRVFQHDANPTDDMLRRLLLLAQEEKELKARIDLIWKEEMLPHYNQCQTMEEFQRLNADFRIVDPLGQYIEMPGNIPLHKAFVVDRIRHGGKDVSS